MFRGLVVGAGAISYAVLVASPLEFSRVTSDGGAVVQSSGGNLELHSTIAQPDAGYMSGGSLELTSGFWFAQSDADCNEDGGVDRGDHALFTLCALGPAGAIVESGCACFDVDQSDSVDLADFAVVQTRYVGP